MDTVVPNYYKNFQCIAEKCRHNCCIGWEIDIDNETFLRYQSVGGAFGKRLQKGIAPGEETPYFKLNEAERCPFLNENNLCDIVLELGENSLCQICSDHPRFRNFFDSFCEVGLGLCCEAAGTLILGQTEKFSLPKLEENVLTEEEKSFLKFRQTILDCFQNREQTVTERIETVFQKYGINFLKKSPMEWAKQYLQLEFLENAWQDELQQLLQAESVPLLSGECWEIPLEQLLVYFVYRHLSAAMDDGLFCERLLFCVLSHRMILWLSGLQQSLTGAFSMDDFVEIARMYSSEIEYSEKNTQALLETFL